MLGLENVQAAYVGKNMKRGSAIGRVIEYLAFLARIGEL